MKKIIPLMLLVSYSSFAQDYVMENVVAPKGYVLSIDLYEKECPNIWSKQIKIFKEKNQHIKNPNLIGIGQEIQVQNCKQVSVKEEPITQPSNLVEVEEKIIPKKEKSEGFSFFLSGSYLNQQTAKKDNDGRKNSEGYKIEIGKYFTLGEEQLKVSLGFARISSVYHNEDFNIKETRPNGFLTFDTSYLFNLNSKMQLGPNLGVFYQPYEKSARMNDYKNRSRDSKVSEVLGGNLVYSLNDDWKIDLKINNRIENRINLWSSIGLEYNF